jgi:hypothetical protein
MCQQRNNRFDPDAEAGEDDVQLQQKGWGKILPAKKRGTKHEEEDQVE